MKNMKLAAVLALCLVVAVILAFCADSAAGRSGDAAQKGSYDIVISEICTKNETVIADAEGNYRDYIELYNGGETVSLAGFTLTDGKRTSEPFGEILLEAGEYRVFFLGDRVTGFGLGASGGDCIQLRDPAGNIVAQANTAAVILDQVMLYSPSGYQLSDDASPGFENSAAGMKAFREGSLAEDPALIISELLIGNVSSLPDEQGRYSDVVEIHNVSGQEVYLGHYFLSDDPQQRFRFRLPDRMLSPDDYLVVYCDGQNYVGPDGHVHAAFGLTHGESLVLTDHLGSYTTVIASHEGDDISLSRREEGSYEAGWVSLGYANSEAGVEQFQESRINRNSPLVISEVLLSSAEVPYEGSFSDVAEIWNRSAEPVSLEGWYLSDGGDPYSYPLGGEELAPGERRVILCTPQTTGFGLSEGEILRLTGPDFLSAPVVACVSIQPGCSISLQDDGPDLSYDSSEVTLGYENTKEGRSQYMQAHLPKGLLISEVMTANNSYLKGSYATTCDWVELYNNSTEDVNLGWYSLSENSRKPNQYPLPERTVKPGESCVVFLSEDPLNLLPEYPVLPFTLSSEGARLYLTMGSTVADHVIIPALPMDMSYGRGEGSAEFALLPTATPGEQNGKAAEMSVMPTAVTPQGTYDDVEYVEVELSGSGEIYYTLDATTPGGEALLYSGPIRLDKTTVVRAVCREPGKLQSQTLNLTYVINENDKLDVVCLVTDPDNLWSSYAGIYANGPGMGTIPPYYGANFWKDWERPASFSLFEAEGGGFSINCGIKIFGGFTRTLPKKSLALMFRDKYGASELTYPVFGENSLDSYESLILRTGGQDSMRARMRDVLVTSLLGEATDMDIQQHRPVVVYLNGKYWGLHYIREKLNENYVAGHHNVPREDVTVVEYSGWTSPEYHELIKYVENNDMRVQEHYDYVCTQMDIDSYLDFFITQQWIANTDNQNVKYYRYEGGKWTWFVFDTDLSCSVPELNSLFNNLSSQGRYYTTCSVFAVYLLKNDDFRDRFLTRFAWHMNNIWTEEKVLARIDEYEARIAEDMVKDCERWNQSYRMWTKSVEELRKFVRNRDTYLLQYIQNYFDLSDAQMRSYGFNV